MMDNTVEDKLTHLFRQQAARVEVPPPDPRSVLALRARPGARSPNQGPGRFALLGAMALVAVVAGGAAIVWSSPGTVTGPGEAPPPIPALERPFVFDTGVGVRLRAADITVNTGDRTFSPTGDEVEVTGDPGIPATGPGPGYTTLELTWFEHGVEMRINLYFASDGTDWWVNEIRTRDGTDPGQWLTMPGELAHTPIGQPFVGDLRDGPLHIEAMVLEAFVSGPTGCDGSGQPGQVHLELSGPRPVTGALGTPGVSTGYATTVAVLDAVTCEPVEPDGVTFRATPADPEVAVVEPAELVFGAAGAPHGHLRVEVNFVGVGATTVTIEAVDAQTGDTMARVTIPVTVTERAGS